MGNLSSTIDEDDKLIKITISSNQQLSEKNALKHQQQSGNKKNDEYYNNNKYQQHFMSSKQSQSIKQDNKQNDDDNEATFEAPIFDDFGVKYGVLRGSNIYCYLDKKYMNDLPYQVTNIANYYKIQKTEVYDCPKPFGLMFFDEHNNIGLGYFFQKQMNRDLWYSKLINLLNKNKLNIVDDDKNHNIIYSEWC